MTTTVILEFAEEDGYEFIAVDVVWVTLCHEDVCFVKEDDSVPFQGQLEYLFDVISQLCRLDAQVLSLKVK